MVTVTITSGTDNSLDGIGNDRAKTTGAPVDDISNLTCAAPCKFWFNPAAFAAGDVGTFGTVGKGAYFGPSIHYFDMGLSKNVRFSNDMGMQFRAEFFNVFNRPNFANPIAQLRSPTSFGRVFNTFGRTLGLGTSRQIQFALKYMF